MLKGQSQFLLENKTNVVEPFSLGQTRMVIPMPSEIVEMSSLRRQKNAFKRFLCMILYCLKKLDLALMVLGQTKDVLFHMLKMLHVNYVHVLFL